MHTQTVANALACPIALTSTATHRKSLPVSRLSTPRANERASSRAERRPRDTRRPQSRAIRGAAEESPARWSHVLPQLLLVRLAKHVRGCVASVWIACRLALCQGTVLTSSLVALCQGHFPFPPLGPSRLATMSMCRSSWKRSLRQQETPPVPRPTRPSTPL